MKTRYGHVAGLILFFVAFVLVKCGSDDTYVPEPTGRSKVFKIINTNLSDISGTATFIENEDNSTTIQLKLNNMDSGQEHPVFLRRNVAAEGGGTVMNLGSINANIGESSITVSTILSGDPISYDEIINFDGYLGIDGIGLNSGGLIAYTDIGPNELTGESVIYGIVPFGNTTIAGTATFFERVSGTTLIEIGINENKPDTDFPVFIYSNIENAQDVVLISLNSLKSEKGNTSQSQVRTTIEGTPIGYSDLLEINGTIVIHPSSSDLETRIAEGGIGSNPKAVIL